MRSCSKFQERSHWHHNPRIALWAGQLPLSFPLHLLTSLQHAWLLYQLHSSSTLSFHCAHSWLLHQRCPFFFWTPFGFGPLRQILLASKDEQEFLRVLAYGWGWVPSSSQRDPWTQVNKYLGPLQLLYVLTRICLHGSRQAVGNEDQKDWRYWMEAFKSLWQKE